MRDELEAHGAGLERLPEIVLLSKRDLLPAERVAELEAEWRERLGDSVLGVLAVSSATGEGLERLTTDGVRAAAVRGARRRRSSRARAPAEFEAEHIVYSPAGDGGFEVVREDRAYRVAGRGIELLVERHDLSNLEALAYLEQRLREIGVIAALQRAGFEPGDEVGSASRSSSSTPAERTPRAPGLWSPPPQRPMGAS